MEFARVSENRRAAQRPLTTARVKASTNPLATIVGGLTLGVALTVMASSEVVAQSLSADGLGPGVRFAESNWHGRPPSQPAGVVSAVVEVEGDPAPVRLLRNVEQQVGVDAHRMLVVTGRRAQRYRLCRTPCRLVFDAPLHLQVAGVEFNVSPEGLAQDSPQGWRVFPRRSALNTLGRSLVTMGVFGALLSIYFLRRGALARYDGLSGTEDDASFRGGIAGVAMGFTFLVVGLVMARRTRGRVRRFDFPPRE